MSLQQGKPDAAAELCRKCLHHNAACARAWEFLGSLQERSEGGGAGGGEEAVGMYEKAWAAESEAAPGVGYRLAAAYLRAKRPLDAIAVCHKVLAACPTFPGIRAEVLDRARAALRP